MIILEITIESLTWVTVLTVTITGITLLVLRLRKSKNTPDKDTKVSENFKPTEHEKGFIDFILKKATKGGLSKESYETVLEFFSLYYERAVLQYVNETGKGVGFNRIQEMLKFAAKTYTN